MNEKKRDEKRVCMHEKERNALETHLRKNVYLKKEDQKKNTRINDRARATTTRYFFILSLFIRMVFFSVKYRCTGWKRCLCHLYLDRCKPSIFICTVNTQAQKSCFCTASSIIIIISSYIYIIYLFVMVY